MRHNFFHARLLRLVLRLIVCCLCALPAHADTSVPTDLLETLNQQLDSAEQALPDAAENTLLLDKLATQAATLSQQAQKCIDDHRQQNIQTQQAIDSLGEITPATDADVKLKFNELGKQQQQNEKIISQCRLSSLRATTLLESTNHSRQLILKQQLFTPSASLPTHLYVLLFEPGVWKLDTIETVSLLFQSSLQWSNLLMAFVYGSVGLLAGVFVRKRLKNKHNLREVAVATSSPTLGSLWRYLLQFLPYTLFVLLMAFSLFIAPVNFPLLPDNDLMGLLRVVGGTLLGGAVNPSYLVNVRAFPVAAKITLVLATVHHLAVGSG